MRATKLLPQNKDPSYHERLRTLDLPTLKYWRLRGDLTERYKIITHKQASELTIKFNIIPTTATRGIYKIRQDHVKYDLHKLSFSNRITIIVWKSLPDTVVKIDSVNSLKNRLDKYLTV